MKNIRAFFCCLVLLMACADNKKGSRIADTSARPDGDVLSSKSHKLRYVFFSNGGLLGFFADSSVTKCRKCDLCTENIKYLIKAEKDGAYFSTDSFLVTIDIEAPDTMFFYPGRYPSYENWAMIDYKWIKDIDSCR